MKRWCLAVFLAATGLAVTAAGASDLGGAEALYRAGRCDEAEAAFRQLVADQPDSAAGLYHLGKLAVRRGEHAVATGLLERAIALAPRESDYHHWLGNSYAWAAASAPLCDKAALGRKCLAAYQRALELDPANLPARFSLMNFYRHVPRLFGGGPGRARNEADEIRRRDPGQGAYARAVLLGDEKKYAEAFAVLADLLRQNPTDYAAHFLFGRLALASGERLEAGIVSLRRCLELTPTENDESHETAARCLGELNALRPTQEVVARLR